MSKATLTLDVEVGAARLRDPFLLGVRLLWGSQFALAGFGKLANLDGAAAAFAGWGFPAPEAHAVLAGSTELVGGALLVLGLGTRPVGLVLSVILLVALGTAHRGELLASGLLDASPVLTALPATYLLASLVALFVGGGAWSLDHALLQRAGASATALTAEVA